MKKEIKISSWIAKCEACAHWFCMEYPQLKYKKCDFCGKEEEIKYHGNPQNLYEFTGAIVNNRWRYFEIKELFGIKSFRFLLCSEDCMKKLLEKIKEYFKIDLVLYGTYWQEGEIEDFKNKSL